MGWWRDLSKDYGAIMTPIRDIIFDKCVYTIISLDIIDRSLENEEWRGSFIEKKNWKKAGELADQASREDKIFPLLIADAAHIDGVLAIAQIDEIEILTDGGTKITFSGAHYLNEIQPLSKLRLLSSGEFLSDRYIRSYALCDTPEFAYEDGERIFANSESSEYVAKFKKALLQIEPKMSEGQRKMLLGHYAAPNLMLSVTKLARFAGYEGASSGNLHYGKLARMIAEALEENPPTQDYISTIAQWSNNKDEAGHGQWILYNEVAKALEELGWVKIESNPPQRDIPIPLGVEKPKEIISQTTQRERDPMVRDWVLQSANGFCECCKQKSPFEVGDGVPYLEVHHVRHLANDGSDRISNTVALCPNCHRELHHGKLKEELIENLYASIQRLIRE